MPPKKANQAQYSFFSGTLPKETFEVGCATEYAR
jgi:hypothetical protein